MRKFLWAYLPLMVCHPFALAAVCPALASPVLKIQNVRCAPYARLSHVLNGTYEIANVTHGTPSARSINVANDPGGSITRLTSHYAGSPFSGTTGTRCLAGSANGVPASAPRALTMLGICLLGLVPLAGQLWRAVRK